MSATLITEHGSSSSPGKKNAWDCRFLETRPLISSPFWLTGRPKAELSTKCIILSNVEKATLHLARSSGTFGREDIRQNGEAAKNGHYGRESRIEVAARDSAPTR